MIRHYFTLFKLTEELQFLKGYRIAECFTQEKNSLVIMLYRDGNEYYLCYSGDSKLGGLYLKNEFSRAKKNTINIFDFLNNKEIKNISIVDNERIIQIFFDHFIMNFILFGASKSNVVMTDPEGRIIDAFKNKKNLINTNYQINRSRLQQIEEFPAESNILKSIAESDFLFGKYYADEFCKRMSLNPLSRLGENTILIEELKRNMITFKSECLNSKEFYIVEDENEQQILSLIKLKSYPKIVKSFDSINEAIKFRIFSTHKEISFNSEFKKVKSIIEKQEIRLQNNLKQLEDSDKFHERIEKYKIWAEALQNLVNMKERVGSSVNVALWDSSEISVPLNPKLTIRENIDTYFQKIKDSNEDEKIRQKRIPIIKSKLNRINSAAEKLDLCLNIKDLENFKIEYKNILKNTMEELQSKEEKFRSFVLGEGYILYVGKNAANNDELTMHFARPNDIWLHARGAGGSHCVLRMKSKEEKPPKMVLQKAAEITAYYSQARKGKFVPVAYTQKKYVHKPKGADPGSVVISKEQVIMVEPKLPVTD